VPNQVAQPLVGQEQPDDNVDNEDDPGDPTQQSAQVEQPARNIRVEDRYGVRGWTRGIVTFADLLGSVPS
jgi:hypothetical protein